LTLLGFSGELSNNLERRETVIMAGMPEPAWHGVF